MADVPRSLSADRPVKVILAGAWGSGKVSLIKAVAEEYAHGAVRAGEMGEVRIFRTEFGWPADAEDGERRLVRLYGVSGRSDYNAVSELLLADADGIVFVASLAREQAPAVRAAFQALVFNARHRGLDLAAMPVAFHYRRVAMGPVLEADEMEEFLGIPPGAVPRFVTGPDDRAQLRVAVEWVVVQLADRSRPRGGRPAPGEARVAARRA